MSGRALPSDLQEIAIVELRHQERARTGNSEPMSWDLSALNQSMFQTEEGAATFLEWDTTSDEDRHRISRFLYGIMYEYNNRIHDFLQHGMHNQPLYSSYNPAADTVRHNNLMKLGFPLRFFTDLVDIGCGDGRKAVKIYEELTTTPYLRGLQLDVGGVCLWDSSQEMLDSALAALHTADDSIPVATHLFDFHKINPSGRVVYEESAAISRLHNPMVSKLEYLTTEKGSRARAVPHPNPLAVLFGHDWLPGQVDNGVLTFSTYLFLGRTLGNDHESYHLLHNLLSVLGPYDVLVVEVDTSKDVAKYKEAGPQHVQNLEAIGIHSHHIRRNGELTWDVDTPFDEETGRSRVEGYFTLEDDVEIGNVHLKRGDRVVTFISKSYLVDDVSYFKSGTVLTRMKDGVYPHWEGEDTIIRTFGNHSFSDTSGHTFLVAFGGIGLTDYALNKHLLTGDVPPLYLSR